MTVVLNEAAISNLLNSTTGPVGVMVARKASLVYEQAVINTSGPILNRRSGQLQDLLRVQVIGTPQGAQATVGTTATSTWHGAPFDYPAHLERLGYRWLSSAVRRVFPL